MWILLRNVKTIQEDMYELHLNSCAKIMWTKKKKKTSLEYDQRCLFKKKLKTILLHMTDESHVLLRIAASCSKDVTELFLNLSVL